MSDPLFIEDRIAYWRDQLPGSEDETHTELLCDAEDELRELRAALQAATERATGLQHTVTAAQLAADLPSDAPPLAIAEHIAQLHARAERAERDRDEAIGYEQRNRDGRAAAEAERDSLARMLQAQPATPPEGQPALLTRIIDRLEDVHPECCGDPPCAQNPEYRDLPSKWCDNCIVAQVLRWYRGEPAPEMIYCTEEGCDHEPPCPGATPAQPDADEEPSE